MYYAQSYGQPTVLPNGQIVNGAQVFAGQQQVLAAPQAVYSTGQQVLAQQTVYPSPQQVIAGPQAVYQSPQAVYTTGPQTVYAGHQPGTQVITHHHHQPQAYISEGIPVQHQQIIQSGPTVVTELQDRSYPPPQNVVVGRRNFIDL
jgi:hypothetical protein